MRDEGKAEKLRTPERRAPRKVSRTPSPKPKASHDTEFDFIRRLRERAAKASRAKSSNASSLIPPPSSLVKGIGDDAAVIRQSGKRELVITADLLVEEIDFRLAWSTPEALGHKALAVSLSDIAAMGALPRFALLSLGLPQKIWKTDFADRFYEGFFALADAHGVALIGGDISRTPERVVIDSIVLGDALRGRAVMRRGARTGDHIFVTGSLGGSAAGLKLLAGKARPGASSPRSLKSRAAAGLIERHLMPNPRVAWGTLLGERRLATAMIDISDGLSSDLAHLCAESVAGARLEAARIPVDPLIAVSGAGDLDPLELSLDGGEDFELLFTVSPRQLKKLPTEVEGVRATYIGDVTDASEGIRLSDGSRTNPLRPSGFRHF